MAIDKNLENKFLDMVNNKDTSSKSSTVYGTVTSVDATDSDYRVTVRIDGSDRNITLQTTTACKNDDRVIVQIKDHSAIIIGKVIPDIVASKVTAGEINITDISELGKVDDLNKLSGKISGIHLNPAAMYSGDKNALTSNSQGLYLGADGQISIGDANNYLTFFKTDSGEWKLMVSASTISFGGGTDLATAINNANTAAGNAYSYAGSAYSKASTANDTANKAKDAANEAAKTATNYLSYDSTDGLLIRQHNAASSLGTSESNVQLTSTAFNIRKGTKTYLNVTSTGIKIYTDSQTQPIAQYGDGYMRMVEYIEDGVYSEVYISPSEIHMLDKSTLARMSINTLIYSLDTGGTIPAVQITSDQMEMRAVTSSSAYASTGVSSHNNEAWIRATNGSQNTRVTATSDYAIMYYSGSGYVRVDRTGSKMYYGSSYVYTDSDSARLNYGNSYVKARSECAELWYSNNGGVVQAKSGEAYMKYSNSYAGVDSSGAHMYYTNGGGIHLQSDGVYMESFSGGPCVNLNSSEARIGYGSNKVVSDSTGTRISVGGYNRLDTNYNGYGALILGRYYNETGYYMSFWGHGIFIKYQSSSGIGGGYDLVQITSTSIKFRPSNSDIFSINQDALYSKRDLYMNGYSIRNQSDRRMKTDFVDASKWDEFYDRLNPCGFKYKNLDNGYHIGFVAQDVEQALTDSGLSKDDFSGLTISPYYAMGDEESEIQDGEDVYNLAYTEFIALNTHEIQKLKTKVSTLESRIEALENLLTNL